ncbi:MAG: hypothetical protein ABII21_04480 [bacterium]
MKKIKSHNAYTIKLVAVFVAGLAVATLIWWQSDRLDLAFGASADINKIQMGDYRKVMQSECGPGSKPKVTRKINGCEIVAATTTCTPIQSYISVRKTKSGIQTAISDRKIARSQEQVTYKEGLEERHNALKEEANQVRSQIASMQKGRRFADLTKDSDYQEKVAWQKELDNAIRQNPKCIAAK